MRHLDIGEIKIPYRIKWSGDRSSLGLGIDKKMKLSVRAPQSVSIEAVEEKIQEKKGWLLKKIRELQEQKQAPQEKEFLSGEKLIYKGRKYRLEVLSNEKKREIKFQKGKFVLTQGNYKSEEERREEAKSLIENWYKRKAKKELAPRVEKIAQKMNLTPKTIEVEELNKKWGQTKNKSLKLNWHLIMAPPKIYNYIIVHELTHLKETNHTDKFWNTVGTLIPDYEERIEWLRINGVKLKI